MESHSAILSPRCTVAHLGANSKKRALELAAEFIAQDQNDMDARDVFDALLARERLGSTALGDGVAIPHCRVDCKHIMGAFLTLETPIEFETPDDQPVRLIFVLVVPTTETDRHLEVLATLAGIFGDADTRAQLLAVSDDETLYQMMSERLG